ncbi:MAG: oxidative damage protection protein [Calditrichaeota bacterium]|nr:MAG: oxidative damage protection protein [Calditrichota bacterium]
MAKIKCARCGQEKEGLAEIPFKNELGEKLGEQTCQDCWQAWVGQQLMLMNEYRLDPMNEEHSKFLDEEMKKFLNLT